MLAAPRSAFALQDGGRAAAAISHDYARIVRYDPTGSVHHAREPSLICLLLALARAAEPGPLPPRHTASSRSGGVALVMVLRRRLTRRIIVSLTFPGQASPADDDDRGATSVSSC